MGQLTTTLTKRPEVIIDTPEAPTSLVATTVDFETVGLVWEDNSDNEAGFRIETSPDGMNDWVAIDRAPANAEAHDVTGLDYNTEYYFQIIAYNAGGDSSASNSDNATTDDIAPAAPTLLVAVTGSDTTIDLTWQDNSDNEVTFRVEVSDDGLAGWTTVDDTIVADLEVYEVTTLDPETEYFFRVFAVNAIGDSLPSNVDSATTDPA